MGEDAFLWWVIFDVLIFNIQCSTINFQGVPAWGGLVMEGGNGYGNFRERTDVRMAGREGSRGRLEY
jgi:hypothetical protein